MNSLAIAHVPDVIELATFAEANVLLQKTEENLNSVICLTRLHKAAKYYPDYFCDRKKRQLTLQHMEDRVTAAGAATNFAGAELLNGLHHLPQGRDILQAATRVPQGRHRRSDEHRWKMLQGLGIRS